MTISKTQRAIKNTEMLADRAGLNWTPRTEMELINEAIKETRAWQTAKLHDLLDKIKRICMLREMLISIHPDTEAIKIEDMINLSMTGK